VKKRQRNASFAPDIPKLCAIEEMRAIVDVGECAHAVGHALAQIDADANAALAACSGGHAHAGVAHYCSGGVVMDRGSAFFADGPKRVCAGVPRAARAACYYYGLRNVALHARNATGEVARAVGYACPPAGAPGRRACVFGAGSAFTKNHMTSARCVEGARYCESLEVAARPACVDGLMFRSGKFGSEDMRREGCAAFRDPELAGFCRDVAGAGMYSLRKDALLRQYGDWD